MSKKYTKEFKESIIKMMRDGANVHDLSQEYGSHYQTILKWGRYVVYESNSVTIDVNMYSIPNLQSNVIKAIPCNTIINLFT